MKAVREGRSSRAKRINKPRTVADNQDIPSRSAGPDERARRLLQACSRARISVSERSYFGDAYIGGSTAGAF